jgi:hypothetical protein
MANKQNSVKSATVLLFLERAIQITVMVVALFLKIFGTFGLV